jgi:hypothetical protein
LRNGLCDCRCGASKPHPLFRLSPDDQRDWLVRRSRAPSPAARNLSDGFACPAVKPPTLAAVLVPLVNRPIDCGA